MFSIFLGEYMFSDVLRNKKKPLIMFSNCFLGEYVFRFIKE